MEETMPIHLLIVEDNPGDVLLLQSMLERSYPGQYTTVPAATLEEAREALARQTFDVVLLDLALPDSAGLETVDRVSAAAPSVPIVVLTGLADEEVGLETVRHGAGLSPQGPGRRLEHRPGGSLRHRAETHGRGSDGRHAQRRMHKAAAEQASRAKDHFLAVLSHELRTPLTPVLATVVMLQDDPRIDEELRQHLEVVRRNVELEARLIDDLLDVSRIERGKVDLDIQSHELCTILRRAVEVCMPDIEARALHFGVDVPDGPYLVEADAARLQQVFWNLLKNAIKFTPVGGCVGIRCRRDGHGPRRGRGQRQRRGHRAGRAAPDLQRLRARGAQPDAAVRRAGAGPDHQQGDGGAARREHRGPDAGKDQGTTFRVRLPLSTGVKCPAATPRGHYTTETNRPARALRILLVEDHGDTAWVMKRLLVSEGHEVQTAADVATALTLASEQIFDLLLSDLGLPDGSGLDLMRAMRARARRWWASRCRAMARSRTSSRATPPASPPI